jgi:hypothetical protein
VKWTTFFVVVVGVGLALPTATPAGAGDAGRSEGGLTASPEAASFAVKEFSWNGSCRVICNNGTCEQHVDGGTVFAIDEGRARIEAEAKIRQSAGQRGTVVEGSISIRVTITERCAKV